MQKTSPDCYMPLTFVAFSLVIPVHNEQENLLALLENITHSLVSYEGRYEIVFADDASTDDTLAVLQGLQEKYPMLSCYTHACKAGQSRALYTAIQAAKNDIIVTLDGDGQNDSRDIEALLSTLLEDFDGDVKAHLEANTTPLAMIAGVRVRRYDSFAKKAGSKFANFVRAMVLRDGAVDTACGLKVFYREAFLRLPYFDHMHRYLPALIQREGLGVAYQTVNHKPRIAGRSNYNNMQRLWVSVFDLAGVFWLLRRRRRPLQITASVPMKVFIAAKKPPPNPPNNVD